MDFKPIILIIILFCLIVIRISYAQPNPADIVVPTPIPGVVYGSVSYGSNHPPTQTEVIVNVTDNNTATNITLSPTVIPRPPFRPMGGQEVFVGEYIDATGCTGWADSIAYYDGWSNEGTPVYVLELPHLKQLYSFYIDPNIFGNKTGMWYQYYGPFVNDGHGFISAFKVVRGFRNTSTTYNNGTINFDNTTDNHTCNNFIPPPVSTRHVSDYLVSRGDNLTIKTNEISRVWIFGTNDGLYYLKSWNNSVFINTTTIDNLRIGNYKIVIQTPGSDREFNVVYNADKKILSALYSLPDSWTSKDYNVDGFTPFLLYDKLISEIDKTDDGYATYNLVVEDPMIDIISQDEIDLNTASVLQLKGYTNTAKGTQLCFGLDEVIAHKSMDYKDTCTLAQGDEIGDMRYFVASVPFMYDDLSVGTHFITGTTAIGGGITTSFHVYTTWDNDKPRNSTIKYIGGNEYIPKPTPEVIKIIETQVVREVVTQKVVVQLTPDTQLLYNTAKQVAEEENNRIITLTIIIISVSSVLLFGGWYALSVIRRLNK